VAVEDTAHGVAAAHAAGMRCIAIPNQFVALERVCHADLVLPSAAQLRLTDALSRLS
jgi:beta-phosphoglucomutase-like phosphatase (HAD superfamily)